MKSLSLTIFLCSLFFSSVIAGKKPVDLRVDPPYWYVGFDNKELQLLIHSEDISNYKVEVLNSSVKLLKTEKCQNPNYIFIYLEIDPSVQAGICRLEFSYKKKSFRYDYLLKERNSSGTHAQGIDQSDFIYLLFPDRFSNGDVKNDRIEGMHDQSLNRDSMFHRHGGDLAGIEKHVDYLSDLGVTALWINPVVENNQPLESYHGYAATDCYKVDPRFGDNEQYAALSQNLHQRGIKMIMDVVLNHWGNESWILKDLPDSSWINNWDEFQRTTYRATTLLDPYASSADRKKMTDGWFDHHMPDLNQKNPLLADYLIQNHIWWIEMAGIDALRIDTYAYPDQVFMAEWAEAIKTEFPEITLFGETWVHGTPVQAWFVDESDINRAYDSGLESVTDFQLHYAINNALSEKEGWTEGSLRLYYTLAKDVLYAEPEKLVTFVDNHDLSRFYSVVKEDLNSFFMGMGFLMTTRGIPSIYYGTEILMKNYADPDGKVREDFPGGWNADPTDKFDVNKLNDKESLAFNFIKDLANWRKNTDVITQGKLMQFVPDKGVYVYFRYTDDEVAMVCINFNQSESSVKTDRFGEMIGGNTKFKNVLTKAESEIESSLKLPARSFTLFELSK